MPRRATRIAALALALVGPALAGCGGAAHPATSSPPHTDARGLPTGDGYAPVEEPTAIPSTDAEIASALAAPAGFTTTSHPATRHLSASAVARLVGSATGLVDARSTAYDIDDGGDAYLTVIARFSTAADATAAAATAVAAYERGSDRQEQSGSEPGQVVLAEPTVPSYAVVGTGEDVDVTVVGDLLALTTDTYPRSKLHLPALEAGASAFDDRIRGISQ